MKIFLVIESDFGSTFIHHTCDSMEKAIYFKKQLDAQVNKEWINFRIEEWELE